MSKNMRVFLFLLLTMMLLYSEAYAATDTNRNVGTSDTIFVLQASEGVSEGSRKTGASSETYKSHGTTYTYTQSEKATSQARQNLWSYFDGLLQEGLGSGTPYVPSHNDLLNATPIKVNTKDFLDNIGDDFNQFRDNYKKDNSDAFYNSGSGFNIALSFLKTEGDINNLPAAEKREILKKIADAEGKKVVSQRGVSYGKNSYQIRSNKGAPIINTGFNPNGAFSAHKGIRGDIIAGGMNDASTYYQRISKIYEKAQNHLQKAIEEANKKKKEDNKKETSANDPGNGQTSSDGKDKTGVTNAIDDTITLVAIEDYHISTVQYNYISSYEYKSDKTRWTLFNGDGEPVSDPVFTDNPRHELVFTGYPAGEYVIKAERLADVTRQTNVYYDKCDYLIEAETQNIIYYTQSITHNGMGGSIVLKSKTKREYISTGQEFHITINNKGELKTKSDIQLVE